jgi:hypothetical protein
MSQPVDKTTWKRYFINMNEGILVIPFHTLLLTRLDS